MMNLPSDRVATIVIINMNVATPLMLRRCSPPKRVERYLGMPWAKAFG
jgi:hypothetical protein